MDLEEGGRGGASLAGEGDRYKVRPGVMFLKSLTITVHLSKIIFILFFISYFLTIIKDVNRN